MKMNKCVTSVMCKHIHIVPGCIIGTHPCVRAIHSVFLQHPVYVRACVKCASPRSCYLE